MKETPSNRRIQANRLNAQKSTGPKTDAGKESSSQNALRHGLSSTTFVVANEKLSEFNELRDDFIARYGPRDRVELSLIETLAHCQWNLQRAWTMENESLNLEMLRMAPQLTKEFSSIQPNTRLAAANDELSKRSTVTLLRRYQVQLSNQYHRALKTFLDLRAEVPLAPPGTLTSFEKNPKPNEPMSVSEHPQEAPEAMEPTTETSVSMDQRQSIGNVSPKIVPFKRTVDSTLRPVAPNFDIVSS